MTEEDYYSEITNELKRVFKSNFSVLDGGLDDFDIYFKNNTEPGCQTLKSGLDKLINDYGLNVPALSRYVRTALPIKVDIFGVVIKKSVADFRLIIVEVKKQSLGLTQLSQLIGYCICASAPYGILIGTDENGPSRDLINYLESNHNLSRIIRVVDGSSINEITDIGIMTWQHSIKNFRYTNTGQLYSVPDFCHGIFMSFLLDKFE